MNQKIIIGGLVGAGVLVFLFGARSRPKIAQDVRIDPDFGKHRGLGPVYTQPDSVPTRMSSAQDPKGMTADFLGYNYDKSMPSTYAKGEPAQFAGKYWDKREDQWAEVAYSPIDYGKPPVRILHLWKDANRYWDGINSRGGVEVVGQRVHLYHLRPSAPTRGVRSISGGLAPIGGGMSTASRVRVPSIFVPSVVS